MLFPRQQDTHQCMNEACRHACCLQASKVTCIWNFSQSLHVHPSLIVLLVMLSNCDRQMTAYKVGIVSCAKASKSWRQLSPVREAVSNKSLRPKTTVRMRTSSMTEPDYEAWHCFKCLILTVLVSRRIDTCQSAGHWQTVQGI